MSRSQQRARELKNFDPNGAAAEDSGLFGLPFSIENSEVVVLNVPWQATVSYGAGTKDAPNLILAASHQVDLFHPEAPRFWEEGVALCKPDAVAVQYAAEAERLAATVRDNDDRVALSQINEISKRLEDSIYNAAIKFLDDGRFVALLGGEHSTPLGLIRAIATKHSSFGILQIDAHMDLRPAYEGFTQSHASIMCNALNIKELTKLVQVGIRDYSRGEVELVARQDSRIKVCYDRDISNKISVGVNFAAIIKEAVEALPEKVYISFDIDGLDPSLCPGTGTPVPGGLSFNQAAQLVWAVKKSGRKIIGFDLVEVGNSEWDANVGARVLYELCAVAIDKSC